MINLRIKSIASIRETAAEFLTFLHNGKIFLFDGTMGAGKTTFIKAVCETMGVTDTINSPTFSIVNEYETINGEIIYHFDCYRINKIQDAVEIGIEEYLHSGHYCFIEWAENIATLLPDDAVHVSITEQADGTRIVALNV